MVYIYIYNQTKLAKLNLYPPFYSPNNNIFVSMERPKTYTYKDFAIFFGCSTWTIRHHLGVLKLVLKNFDEKKRKRLFNEDEAQIVISELKKTLKIKDKREKKTLSEMYNSPGTTA